MTLEEATNRITELEEELSELQDKLYEAEEDRDAYEWKLGAIKQIL